MAKADGSVIINTKFDLKNFEKNSDNVVKKFSSMSSAATKLCTTLGLAFSTAAIIQFGKESAKAAQTYGDALIGLQSIVEGQGRSFSEAQKFIEEYTQDGLVPATDAITAYKNLAMRGYDDSQIKQVMVALKDASAYGRQASYTMGQAVASATEGLKNENSILVDNAGVTKNVAKMWDEYAASIGTTANNLTQQQKIQAEVSGILAESKYQTGDAAKVAGTLSGQLQQLSFGLNNLKIAVGNIINPFVKAFLPAINAAITAVTKFANTIAATVNALFGTNIGEFAETVGSVDTGFESAAEGAEDLAAATKKAGKEAKKSLAGFDEITTLAKESGTGDGGVSDTLSSVLGAGQTNTSANVAVSADVSGLDKVKEKIESVTKFISDKFSPSISAWSEAFSKIAPAAKDAAERVGTSFSNLWENSLVPFGEYIVTDFVPTITNEFSETFAPIFSDVMTTAVDVWATDFENSALVVQEATGHLETSFESAKNVFTDMCNSISDNWEKYGGYLLQGFTDFKDGLWETWWYIYDNIINPVITKCSETFTWLWDNHLKQLWDNIVEFVLSVSGNILAIWNNFLKPVINYLVAAFAPAISNVIKGIKDAVAIVYAFIADIISGLLKYFDGFIQFIAGIFTLNWERAWGGIVKMFEGAWTHLSGIVKGVVNSIIWVINQLISGIYSGIAGIVNGLGSIVSSVGNILGKNWGFSVPTVAPSIPYLAQGAVIPPNAPFMAMLGDQRHGTNIEAPLSTIQEAVAIVMEDMVKSNLAGHEATVAVLREILEAVLGIEIGDDVIGSAVLRYNRKMAVVKGGAL